MSLATRHEVISPRGVRLTAYYDKPYPNKVSGSGSGTEECRKGMLIIHGYAEHADRYRSFREALAREGFHVFSLDLAGHGRSDGKRAYIRRFEGLVDDVEAWFSTLQKQHPQMQWFVFGHSMGGAVALRFTLRVQESVAGLLLSGPMLRLPDNVPGIVRAAGRLLAVILPAMPAVPLEVEALSRNPDVIRRYLEDPLVYSKPVRARTAIQLDKQTRSISAHFAQIRIPLWIGHGDLDRITDPAGSRLLHAEAASADKTLRIFNGLFHEILNEPEGEVVQHEILLWLRKRALGTD